MSKQVSSLSVALFATVEPFANGLKAGERAATSFIGRVGDVGSSLLGVTGIAATAAAALGTVFAVGKGFDAARQYEAAAVQLRALTGSADKAGAVLGGLRSMAAVSPFEFPELLTSAKRLLAVGVSASNVPPLLTEIGDVAAGVGAPVGDLADTFARVAAEGQLGSREIRSMVRDGIPIMSALAAATGVNANQVAGLAEAGRIGFKQLKGAFDVLTGPAGRFGGILAAQADTVGGALHGLAVTAVDVAADVEQSLMDAFDFRGALKGVTGAVRAVGAAAAAGLAEAGPTLKAIAAGAVGTFAQIYATARPVLADVGSLASRAFRAVASAAEAAGPSLRAFAVNGVGELVAFYNRARPVVASAATAIGTAFDRVASYVVPVFETLRAA